MAEGKQLEIERDQDLNRKEAQYVWRRMLNIYY
jgi:hypothetical protein